MSLVIAGTCEEYVFTLQTLMNVKEALKTAAVRWPLVTTYPALTTAIASRDAAATASHAQVITACG